MRCVNEGFSANWCKNDYGSPTARRSQAFNILRDILTVSSWISLKNRTVSLADWSVS